MIDDNVATYLDSMKPALRYQQQELPLGWQDIAHGEEIKQSINAHMLNWWPKFFGYHLLKVGNLSCELNITACQIKHQVGVAEHSNLAGVKADIDELPFSHHAVDVAILSHCLEFCPDPHHLIREAHRVLIPDGHLVISGFNPYSFCGLAKLAYFRSEKFPWSGRFFSSARIKDWLHLLGFEVLEEKRMTYSSLARKNSLSRYRLWNNFCRQYLPKIGSVYVLVAKKRELPLTPIKPKWRAKPQFNPATAKSALRENKSN
ncbi:MAG: SAM-dependent methyltransferase [Phenylobacterium sp.]